MRRALTWGRILALACGLLLPGVAWAAADPALAVDLDGDGRHDRVVLDYARPSVLQIWLSASNTTYVLQSRRPLQRVAVADLDGDRRPELIARDSESKIHIWAHRPKGFLTYRLRNRIPIGLSQPVSRHLRHKDTESLSADARAAAAPLALLRASARARDRAACRAGAATRPRVCRLFVVSPFAPRPPPAPLSL